MHAAVQIEKFYEWYAIFPKITIVLHFVYYPRAFVDMLL